MRLAQHRIFADRRSSLQRFLEHTPLSARQAELQEARERRRDINICRGQGIVKARWLFSGFGVLRGEGAGSGRMELLM